MSKKTDKRLCWNCDGSLSLHLTQCPYCGVDSSQVPPHVSEKTGEKKAFSSFSTPYQNISNLDSSIPKPPYATEKFYQNANVSEEEWNRALGEENEDPRDEEEGVATFAKWDMIALLLLLPGVVLFLFGLALFFFSSDGLLTLEWNASFAYFYFLGSVPLLFLGWRALR